jgi:single-strand DNA-binding protein
MNWNENVRLTRDPEIVEFDSGNKLAKVGIAYNTGWGDNEETCFLDVNFWGKEAERVEKFLKKGSYIKAMGVLKMETWDSDSGKRSKHMIDNGRFAFIQGTGGNNSSDSPAPDTPARAGKISDDDVPQFNNDDLEQDIPF